MARADDTGAQIENGVEVDDTRCRSHANESHLVEHRGDQDGGEQFKETLHPKVNDPEAPIVDHREVGVRTIQECREIEDWNSCG